MMKKFFINLLLSFAAIFAIQMVVSAMPDLQTMDGPHYLTDDRFKNNFTYNNTTIVSGWDVDNSGGPVSYLTDRLVISDTSSLKATKISKNLRSHNSGEIVMETAFSLNNASKGAYLRISGENGTKDIFKMTFGGKASLVTRNGSTDVIKSTKIKQLYGLKVVINLDTDKFDLYIDGKYIGTYDFLTDASCLDFIEASTGVKEKGELGFIGFKIYTGFALNETFYSCNAGNIPDYWNVSSTGGAVTEIATSNASYLDSAYARLKDDTSVGSSKIDRTFDRVTEHGGFEVMFATETDGNEFSFKWNDKDKEVFNILSKNNTLYLNGQKIYDYIKNVWYSVSIEADFKTNKADVYINNRLVAEDIAFNGTGVDGFVAESSIKYRGEVSVDDILAYKVNESESYVPEPVVSESDNFIVGMQTCDMWREGFHYGWDCISPFDERTPYLGFYDEGSREVADWEVKWMVEHGVDYRMTCWFSPRNWNSEQGPMKIGSCGYGLIDGYMRSKYSDKMKYAIMWENTTATKVDTKTFREYIFPYWKEWFLKDSRYMVVDNKPLIYIYTPTVFIDTTSGGDIELAKENIEFIRNECIKLGFDGATIINASSSYNDRAIQMGVDGLYNYNYNPSEFAGGAQEQHLTENKNNYKDVFILPSISMGQEKTAWFREKGRNATVEDFENAIKWVRDSFYENYDNYPLSERTILINTWNEYGEGHYVAPCNKEGFGYLDAVSRTFTNDNNHNDVVPTEEQKDDFCILYPQNREPGMRGEQLSVRIPTEVAVSWKGDSLSAWTNGKQIDGFKVENGIIYGTATGQDPSVMSPDNLGVDTSNITYIKVRIKQLAASKSLSVFFITNDDTKWNEAKGITMSPESTDEGYQDVYFPVCFRDTWKGTLKCLRIDPLNSLGSFEIESIELLRGEPSDTIRMNLDNTLLPFTLGMSSSSSMLRLVQAPIMLDGKVYMPFDCWNNYLGIKVVYNNFDKEIVAINNYSVVEINVETGETFLNEKQINKIPVKNYLGNYILPIREVAETFGYKVGWDDTNTTVLLTSPPEPEKTENADPVYTWNFNVDDDTQNWTTSAQITNVSVMDGILKLAIEGSDPQMTMRNLNLPASKYKTLFIRLKNNTSSKNLELFFSKNTDTTMNQEKRFALTIPTNMDEFVEYEIDLTVNAKWSDTILNVRLDPATASGDFEIDYIRFSEE